MFRIWVSRVAGVWREGRKILRMEMGVVSIFVRVRVEGFIFGFGVYGVEGL